MGTEFKREHIELADKLRGLDPSIQGLSLVDGHGQLLAFSPESHYAGKSAEEKEGWAMAAQRMALLISIAVSHDDSLSPLQSIVLIRKELKEVAVRLPVQDYIAIALVPQSINGAVIASKVKLHFP